MAADDDGSLSPNGRFLRMEKALLRIEDRLQELPDAEDYGRLAGRLDEVEHGTSPLVKLMLDRIKAVEERQDSLDQRLGQMRTAQEQISLAGAARANAASEAAEAAEARAVASHNRWMKVVGAITAVNAIVTAAGVLINQF